MEYISIFFTHRAVRHVVEMYGYGEILEELQRRIKVSGLFGPTRYVLNPNLNPTPKN